MHRRRRVCGQAQQRLLDLWQLEKSRPTRPLPAYLHITLKPARQQGVKGTFCNPTQHAPDGNPNYVQYSFNMSDNVEQACSRKLTVTSPSRQRSKFDDGGLDKL
jgi:hypothetical protein